MAMQRAWQDSLAAQAGVASNDNRVAPMDAAPIIVPVGDYLQTEIVDQMLPALLLDRLADLHWLEQEPALAV
jgi:hypothetical protein